MDIINILECYKNRIVVRYINKIFNQNRLCENLIFPVNGTDIAIEIVLDMPKSDHSTNRIFTIPKNILLNYDINEDELLSYAIENTKKIRKPFIKRLDNLLFPFSRNNEDIPSAVVSNDKLFYGTIFISFPEIQRMVKNILHSDFYILPSSVHESICVPDYMMSKEELLAIVKTVNKESFMNKDNILADDVFIIQDGVLCSAFR